MCALGLFVGLRSVSKSSITELTEYGNTAQTLPVQECGFCFVFALEFTETKWPLLRIADISEIVYIQVQPPPSCCNRSPSFLYVGISLWSLDLGITTGTLRGTSCIYKVHLILLGTVQ
jgi:hypothetical protein